MKSTTNKLTSGLVIAVLALALSVGVTYVLAATYSEPPTVNSGGTPCTPTTSGCNIDAPLNVGGNLQTKLGALEVNWVSSGFAAIGLRLNGKIQINDASPDVNTVGSVLTNTGNGIGMWAPAGGSAGAMTAKAWFTWRRTTAAPYGVILSSYNIAGIAPSGASRNPPDVTFSSPMSSGNYVALCNSASATDGAGVNLTNYAATFVSDKTPSGFRVHGAYGAVEDKIMSVDCVVFSN